MPKEIKKIYAQKYNKQWESDEIFKGKYYLFVVKYI